MNTDSIPRPKVRKQEYLRSDALRTLQLPPAEILRGRAGLLEEALASEDRQSVQRICNDIAGIIAEEFAIAVPPVTVLGVRPHRVSGGVCVYEKFGDYNFQTSQIRLWMRTALLQKVTSYGTLLSTLCHELCHHVDVVKLGFPNTFHTRGFYERAGLLYHHIRNTPVRPLIWVEQDDGTYRINWALTMGGQRAASKKNHQMRRG